ncbi:MAG TPA: serine hydrolase [Thermoanaerobaculia bacterium]|nr:serine hydrolase [Thermoanaerobaculia bacterium]
MPMVSSRRYLRACLLLTTLFAALSLAPPAAAASARAADAVRLMETLLSGAYPPHGPGAAVVVMKDRKPLLRKGYGLANLELGVPIRPEMVFRLGSITKQFTAVGILMLVAEGKVAFDDEITKFLPDFPSHGQRITVEHLLTHTSGVKSYTDMPAWLPLWRKDFTLPELINFFKNEPPQFSPGEKWEYDNSGYILLGAILEKASGKTYAEFLRQRIFEPLGMMHSFYGADQPIIPGRVSGYEKRDAGWVNAPYLSMTQPYAAGALVSSVDDLALWDAALYTDKLVPQALLARAWTPFRLKNGSLTGYGYGWALWQYEDHRVIEHGGGINGFSTSALRLPEDHVYVAVLTNCSGKKPGPAELAGKLAALAIGQPPREPVPAKVAAEVLDRYVGVYRIDEKETRAVVREGDHLVTQRSGGSKSAAYPLSETEFFYKENPDRIRFVRDAKGETTGMVAIRRYGGEEPATRISKEAPRERQAVELDPAIYDRYVGEYELSPTFHLVVTRDGGRLFTQATGQERIEIFPSSESEFFLRVVDAQITFVRDAAGTVTSLVLHQGGQDFPGRKVQ